MVNYISNTRYHCLPFDKFDASKQETLFNQLCSSYICFKRSYINIFRHNSWHTTIKICILERHCIIFNKTVVMVRKKPFGRICYDGRCSNFDDKVHNNRWQKFMEPVLSLWICWLDFEQGTMLNSIFLFLLNYMDDICSNFIQIKNICKTMKKSD